MKSEKIKNILIVGNGSDFDENKISALSDKAEYIIAADGGAKVLSKLKITPDLILGDMDSIDKKTLNDFKEVKIEVFPAEKDLTDMELALSKALVYKPENIYLAAGSGDYFDHSFANVLIAMKYSDADTNIFIITGNSMIFPLKQKNKFYNIKNRRFSLFPLGEVEGLKVSGAKYDIKKSALGLFDYSISNLINEDALEINMKKGMMFCVLFDEDYK